LLRQAYVGQRAVNTAQRFKNAKRAERVDRDYFQATSANLFTTFNYTQAHTIISVEPFCTFVVFNFPLCSLQNTPQTLLTKLGRTVLKLVLSLPWQRINSIAGRSLHQTLLDLNNQPRPSRSTLRRNKTVYNTPSGYVPETQCYPYASNCDFGRKPDGKPKPGAFQPYLGPEDHLGQAIVYISGFGSFTLYSRHIALPKPCLAEPFRKLFFDS